MARPIQADAEETKRKILETASRLFSERGPGDTTLRQIAGEVGVSMATVHHYFGGKSDLYQAAVDAMFAELHELRAHLEPIISNARNIDEAIELAVRRAYGFTRRHRPAVQLLTRTVLDSGELAPKYREGFLMPFLDVGAQLLAAPLEQPVETVRLSLLSINYLIVRFTLNSELELARIVQRPDASPDELDEQIAGYLATAARFLLGRH